MLKVRGDIPTQIVTQNVMTFSVQPTQLPLKMSVMTKYFFVVKILHRYNWRKDNCKRPIYSTTLFDQNRKLLHFTKDHIATFFNPFMTGGNKIAYMLKQTCNWNLQVSLNVYDVLVPHSIKWVKKEQRYP